MIKPTQTFTGKSELSDSKELIWGAQSEVVTSYRNLKKPNPSQDIFTKKNLNYINEDLHHQWEISPADIDRETYLETPTCMIVDSYGVIQARYRG